VEQAEQQSATSRYAPNANQTTLGGSMSSRANHKLAPICAAWVKEMRELFGEVKVLYVKEGSVEIGERDEWTSPTASR
jgi:ABC-type phosphate transport system substrate-binding protein